MKPGRPARFDYEYERNGTANLFMMFAPLEGWRHVKVMRRDQLGRHHGFQFVLGAIPMRPAIAASYYAGLLLHARATAKMRSPSRVAGESRRKVSYSTNCNGSAT